MIQSVNQNKRLKHKDKNMKRLITLTILVTSLSACGSMNYAGDHFAMSGTPEGIRTFSDLLIGTQKTAKEAPNAKNQYFATRENYEQNITVRSLHKPKGLIQKWFDSDITDSTTIEQKS